MKCLISDEEMSNAERDRLRALALSLFIRIKYEEESKVEATKVGKGRYAAFFADCGSVSPQRELERERDAPGGARPGAPRAGGVGIPAGHSRTQKCHRALPNKSTLLNTYEQAGRSAAAHSEVRLVRTAHTIAHAGCPGCGPMHIRLLFRRNFETGDVISLS